MGRPLYIQSFIIAMIVTATAVSAVSFCNKIEAYSVIDISSGSVVSSFDERFIHPNGHATDEFSYSLTVNRIEDNPASGTVRTSLEILIREGSDHSPGMFEQLNYRENTGLSGTINSFEKLLKYQSD